MAIERQNASIVKKYDKLLINPQKKLADLKGFVSDLLVVSKEFIIYIVPHGGHRGKYDIREARYSNQKIGKKLDEPVYDDWLLEVCRDNGGLVGRVKNEEAKVRVQQELSVNSIEIQIYSHSNPISQRL